MPPTFLIPLPSVSFQYKTFRPMLVRGKMYAGEGGRPRLGIIVAFQADRTGLVLMSRFPIRR